MVDFKEINKDPKSLEGVIKGDRVKIIGVASLDQEVMGRCKFVYNNLYSFYVRNSSEVICLENYHENNGVVVRGSSFISLKKDSKSYDDFDKALKEVEI